MTNSTLLINSSSRPIKQWRVQRKLCDRSHGCNRGNTKIDGITREVPVGSLLRAVTGAGKLALFLDFARRMSLHVTRFSTLVASLASNIERSSVWRAAVPGDVTKFATSIALHRLGLAIAGKMVGSSALVASSRTGSASKSTTRSKSATKSTTRGTNTTASTGNTTWTSWAGARTLGCVSIHRDLHQLSNLQPNVRVDHNCSNGRWYQLR